MVAGFRQQPNGCVLAVVEPESGAEGVVATKRKPDGRRRYQPAIARRPVRRRSGNQAAIGAGRLGGSAPEIASSSSHTPSTASSHASKSC